MIFVSSKGCIQIHTGLVQKLVSMEPWFNVLDPQFNLHLREDHIAEAWLVKKPTNDGIVTSLELFDENFQQIALIFEKKTWQTRIRSLARSLGEIYKLMIDFVESVPFVVPISF
jgi:putative heme degradation protein